MERGWRVIFFFLFFFFQEENGVEKPRTVFGVGRDLGLLESNTFVLARFDIK